MELSKTAIAFNPNSISTLKQQLAFWGIAVVALLCSAPLQGANVTLAWDPSPDALVIGYTVRYGTNSGHYTDYVIGSLDNSAVITGLSEGVSYYFTVSAYTLTGLESDPSGEISYTVPGGGPVGNQPTLNAISNITINEDAGQQTVNLSGITAGLGGILELLGLGVTASSSNPSLIPHPTVSYTSPNTTGTLRFTPAADEWGTATISVSVNNFKPFDNLFTRTFTVTVNAVNDTPTVITPNNLVVGANAGSQTIALNGISSGAANEAQPLTVTATSSDPGLVPNPTVSYSAGASTGALTLIPRADTSGTATITVTVNDGQNQNYIVSRNFNIVVGNPSSTALYVEAESGLVTAPMVSVDDLTASGGEYVNAQLDNQGSISLQVAIQQPGDYVIWCRVLSPDSSADSFFVSVDGGAEEIYGTAQNTWSSNWQWTLVNISAGSPRVFSLSQGQHIFTFRGREKSTKLDALYFTTDRSFSPLQAPRLTVTPFYSPNNRGMQISFQGSVGVSYDLQASEDLLSWKSCWNSPMTTVNRLLSFVDTVPTSSGKRFYRLQVR